MVMTIRISQTNETIQRIRRVLIGILGKEDLVYKLLIVKKQLRVSCLDVTREEGRKDGVVGEISF